MLQKRASLKRLNHLCYSNPMLVNTSTTRCPNIEKEFRSPPCTIPLNPKTFSAPMPASALPWLHPKKGSGARQELLVRGTTLMIQLTMPFSICLRGLWGSWEIEDFKRAVGWGGRVGTQGILLDQKVPLAHSPLGEREGRDRSRCLLQTLIQVDKLPRRHGICWYFCFT